MKKLMLIIAILALAAPAFAYDTIGVDGSSIGGGLFKPSKSVTVSFVATSTDYAAGTKHEQGTKGYGTTSAEPKIVDDLTGCAAGTTEVNVTSATAMPTACAAAN